MRWVDRVVEAFGRGLSAARRRSAVFDHFWLARQRYDDLFCGRLAAAIAYYAFFAAFAVALLAYSVLGYLLEYHLDLVRTVDNFLRHNLPWLDSEEIKGSRGTVGVVGLLGLVFTGVGWVEALRSSQRLIWQLRQQPGNPVIRRLIDLAMLVGLFVLLGAALVGADLIGTGVERIEGPGGTLGVTVSGWLVSVLLNMGLAAALLGPVPRLRIPARRLLPAVALVGVGFTLLGTVGRLVISRSAHGPAYQLVAGAVGLLVYLYLFNQLLLFGAALAATSTHGRVTDLATDTVVEAAAGPAPGTGSPASGRAGGGSDGAEGVPAPGRGR